MPASTRLSLRDICIVCAVYLASFLIVAGFPHKLLAFPLDDSWIHQVVARNLARYGTLGFTHGVWSSGSSSLLWTLILAINWKLLPAINPVIYSGALNVVFLIAIGLGLLAMARKDGLPNSSCWIWALAPALNGNLLWLALLGMEHVLFVALSVLGIYLWFQPGLRSAILCALCLGALSITRPEGAVLAALAVLAARVAHRGRRDILILISVVVLCGSIFLAANLRTSHSLLPMTYEGRKWLYFGNGPIGFRVRAYFLVSLAVGVVRFLRVIAFRILLFPIVVALVAIGAKMQLRKQYLRIRLLCLWCVVLIGIYAVGLPSNTDADRYQPVFIALSFPLLLLGVDTILRRVLVSRGTSRARASFFAASLIAVAFLLGFLSLRFWRETTTNKITLVESTHGRMGSYLASSLLPQDEVAAFDIGRIGYIFPGRIIDLGGLTDSSFLPYMKKNQMISYLATRNISYFVWPSRMDGSSDIPDVLVFTPEMKQQLREIAKFCAPDKIWNAGNDTTSTHARCQILYRLNSKPPSQLSKSYPAINSPGS